MTQLQAELDLFRWEIQWVFIAALVFAAVYMALFDWRGSVTGRALVTLVLSLDGTLLHSVLLIWGVPSFAAAGLGPWWANTLNWLSVVSLAGAGVALLVMTWESVRQALALPGERSRHLRPWVYRAFRMGRTTTRG